MKKLMFGISLICLLSCSSFQHSDEIRKPNSDETMPTKNLICRLNNDQLSITENPYVISAVVNDIGDYQKVTVSFYDQKTSSSKGIVNDGELTLIAQGGGHNVHSNPSLRLSLMTPEFEPKVIGESFAAKMNIFDPYLNKEFRKLKITCSYSIIK